MTPDETEVPKEPTAPEPAPQPASETPAPPAAPETPPPADVSMPPAAPPPPTAGDQFAKTMDQAGQEISKAFSGGVDQNKFILTVVIGLFLPGVGSIINGQAVKGVVEILVQLLLPCFTITMAIFTRGLGVPAMGLVHVLMAADTIVIAARINQGEKFGDWDLCIKPKPGA